MKTGIVLIVISVCVVAAPPSYFVWSSRSSAPPGPPVHTETEAVVEHVVNQNLLDDNVHSWRGAVPAKEVDLLAVVDSWDELTVAHAAVMEFATWHRTGATDETSLEAFFDRLSPWSGKARIEEIANASVRFRKDLEEARSLKVEVENQFARGDYEDCRRSCEALLDVASRYADDPTFATLRQLSGQMVKKLTPAVTVDQLLEQVGAPIGIRLESARNLHSQIADENIRARIQAAMVEWLLELLKEHPRFDVPDTFEEGTVTKVGDHRTLIYLGVWELADDEEDTWHFFPNVEAHKQFNEYGHYTVEDKDGQMKEERPLRVTKNVDNNELPHLVGELRIPACATVVREYDVILQQTRREFRDPATWIELEKQCQELHQDLAAIRDAHGVWPPYNNKYYEGLEFDKLARPFREVVDRFRAVEQILNAEPL